MDLSRVKVLNSVIKLPIKINCWQISLLLKIKLSLSENIEEKRRSVSYYFELGIWTIRYVARIIGKHARVPIGRGLLVICYIAYQSFK